MEKLILVIAALAAYLFPALVAGFREHKNGNSIAVLNLLLGWTLLGWVVALVWAFSAQDEPSGSEGRS